MKRRSRRTFISPANLGKLAALLLALAGVYLSPYGPNSGANDNNPDTPKGRVYSATVVRVADGDTITVLADGAQHKVRLFAVDAPELKQAHGLAAQGWLQDQLLNDTVKIAVVDRDRYGREVAKVLRPGQPCEQAVCADDVDINLSLVQAGHAWWYREFAKKQSAQDKALYRQAEEHAQTARAGLWARPDPQAPWAWRAERRKEQNNPDTP